MKVYLDNAATTPMAPEVFDAISPILKDYFGNPSSTHSFGRQAKSFIENSRRSIAQMINAKPSEITFTSGGTEADNMAINCAVRDLGVKRIITSPIEHHAVLHTVEHLCESKNVEFKIVKLDNKGHVNIAHLKELLQDNNTKTLVSLMHANNEIGTLLPLEEVNKLCKEFKAFFHTDTVQTMGHYAFDMQSLDVDFITCAAHKLHGPKGVGFLYINNKTKIKSFIHGGSQERGLRGGTENIYGIVGLAKAMELAYANLKEHQNHVQQLKSYMIEGLQKKFGSDVDFNGDLLPENSLYTVLNVCLPKSEKGGMLLFTLDLKGIACSGGSACSSGSNQGSHVLTAIQADLERPNVRFSFSRYTTKEEIDFVLDVLSEVYEKNLV
jgi:cysteine desulfurase